MYTFGGFEFPQAMMANVGLITANDPFFNAQEFLSFAQGAYLKIHQATASRDLQSLRNLISDPMQAQLQASLAAPQWSEPVTQLEQAAILQVSHDAQYDTVSVRFGAKTAAKKKNELVEDWTFQRPAANWATLSAPPVTECPSCGAPLNTDANGACHYCKVPVKGVAGDWRLVRTEVPNLKKTSTSSSGCAFGGFWIFIILMTVVLPLVIVGVVLYYVNRTTDQVFGFGTTSSGSNTGVTVNAKPRDASFSGRANFTSGIRGTFSNADDLVVTGGESGSCSTRAGALTGFVFKSVGTTSDSRSVVTVTVTLPAGSQGPGDYKTVPATVDLDAQPTEGSKEGPEQTQFAVAPDSISNVTIDADGGIDVTLRGLKSADPRWAPLDGELTITCK